MSTVIHSEPRKIEALRPSQLIRQPTSEEIRAGAVAKVRRAMRHIENAQNELNAACSELSAITYGHPTQLACGKLRDRVHAFWYRVQNFSYGKRYSLDEANIETLARALAKVQS